MDDWALACLFLILFMFMIMLWGRHCTRHTVTPEAPENFQDTTESGVDSERCSGANEVCERRTQILPISFAIPLSMFRIPGKKIDEFSKLIPGDH